MNKKTILVVVLSFILIGLVAGAVYFLGKPANFRGTMYGEPYPPAPEIELTRDDGSTFRLSEMHGRIVLLFFGYTSCPDVCPITMGSLKNVFDQVGEEDSANIKVVYISVDPQRDTPERVQGYVNHFHSDFIGLSGSEEQLSKVWSDYGIFRQIVDGPSAAGYSVDHTARITLIDQDGNLRVSYAYDTPVKDLVHDLKLLLK